MSGFRFIAGNRGTKLNASPPRTSTIGYGRGALCARTARPATAANKRTMISAWCMSDRLLYGPVTRCSQAEYLINHGQRPRLQAWLWLGGDSPEALLDVFLTTGKALAMAQSMCVPTW